MADIDNAYAHLITVAGVVLLKKLVHHVPAIGESIRFGGEGSEVYYRIIDVIWVYDEPECPFQRVNLGVEKLEEGEYCGR